MSLALKVDKAIALIRRYAEEATFLAPDEGYHVAFSGGKDSVVIKRLVEMAGVKHHSEYSQTTIDPPELTRFLKKQCSDVEWLKPAIPFFARLPERIPPTRRRRWCCREYKEQGGNGQLCVLGVRAAESPNRKANWQEYGPHWGGKMCLLPVLGWTDEDVWAFINREDCDYCELYDEGWGRLG